MDLALSPEIESGLRKGTSAPKPFAMSAISRESVETITRSIRPIFLASSAGSIVWAMRGLPATSIMFFPGIPLDPPLAGMIASIFNYSSIKCFSNSSPSSPLFSGWNCVPVILFFFIALAKLRSPKLVIPKTSVSFLGFA